MKTNNKKRAEMQQEAIADIIETLESGYNGYYCDLHNEVFNTDYYIIGYAQAVESLEEYGIFEAMNFVKEYEESNFGELFTDMTDPEKLVNMLYYVIGDEIIIEVGNIIDEFWNETADEETNAKIVEQLKEMLNN